MMKVRLAANYKQMYWDSANGVTIARGEEQVVDEYNPIVRHALQTGILEVIDVNAHPNIIADKIPNSTFREVVTKENNQRMDEAKDGLRDTESEHQDNHTSDV